MHVAGVNYIYDRGLGSPDELLNRYTTLTGWAEGLASAGARVSVVQRFGRDAEVVRNGVLYRLVHDPTNRPGSLFDLAWRTNRAVVALQPDVIHVNGLALARQAGWLKRLLPHTPLLLQDHAGAPPSRWLSRWTFRLAFRQIDAVSFVAKEQANIWREAGLLRPETPVFELMEGSSTLRLQPRPDARARTGLEGNPLCLWVGRLNANKDPLTVLKGFALALQHLPEAHLAMAYSEDDLLPAAQAWLAQHPPVAARVTLLGCMPHADLEAIYNSADFFLLGSHHEGSGYAVLEALSCGVVPLLTDIPSFRVLTGNGKMGGLWQVGNADTLVHTLIEWHARQQPETPQRVRAFFEEHFSFEAIGRQALAIYKCLLEGSSR